MTSDEGPAGLGDVALCLKYVLQCTLQYASKYNVVQTFPSFLQGLQLSSNSEMFENWSLQKSRLRSYVSLSMVVLNSRDR